MFNLININCSYISLPVKLKLTGTASRTSPYSRFCRRTLCDFQFAALFCSELVLILPQITIVIIRVLHLTKYVLVINKMTEKVSYLHISVSSNSSWTRTTYQLDY